MDVFDVRVQGSNSLSLIGAIHPVPRQNTRGKEAPVTTSTLERACACWGAGHSLCLGAGLCAESCSMSLTWGAGCERSTRLLCFDLHNLGKELGALGKKSRLGTDWSGIWVLLVQHQPPSQVLTSLQNGLMMHDSVLFAQMLCEGRICS